MFISPCFNKKSGTFFTVAPVNLEGHGRQHVVLNLGADGGLVGSGGGQERCGQRK